MSLKDAKPASHKLKHDVVFTWQPHSDYFHIDSNQLHSLIHNSIDIDTMEAFLTLFSEDAEKFIVSYLSKVADGHEQSPIKTTINYQQDISILCLLSAKKITDNHIAGALTPLFTSPTPADETSFFQQIMNNQHRGVILTDEKTNIINCNKFIEESTGYEISELIGNKTTIFNAGKLSKSFYKKMWTELKKSGYWSGIVLTKTKSGKIIPQDLQLIQLTSLKGQNYYLGINENLSENPYRLAGIEHGGIELLTQLPDQSEFLLKVKSNIEELTKHKGLMVISFVPKFDPEIEFEHKKQLASALAYHEKNFCAGFIKKTAFSIAISYKRLTDKPHSLMIFEAIKSRFNIIKERVCSDVYLKLAECSIGVSVWGVDANDEKKLVTHSLQAMYEKHTSNNSNICFYNRSLHDKIKRREKLEKIIRHAVAGQKMEVYFQPIICANQWRVARLEALCRFRDDNGEILNTEEMIQVAEDLQLVAKLDLSIANIAIAQRDKLVDLYGPEVKISVNISLNSDKLVKTIFSDLLKVLNKYNTHLPYITVELTESAYFDSHKKNNNLLSDLQQKGLQIAIDDFGTGYSSLSYLKEGDFDILKIDKSFISNLSVGSHNYYIIKMISHLAHTLNVEVVAEGVETLQEVKVLKDLHVDYMQGYFFAKPSPVDKLSNQLKSLIMIEDLAEFNNQQVELFVYPTQLDPKNTLREVKQLFDSTRFNALPIVVNKKCVGVLTKEQFSLHATPAMGTDRESSQEYRAMDKVVSAMMDTAITTVHETINEGEMHEKIRNHNPLPWVVINDAGQYVAIIDSYHLIQYLNEI